MAPILSITGLYVSIGKDAIVRGVDLKVNAGELHVLMGPNGAGKSTLAQALMGHPGCTVTRGKVRFRGKDLLKLAPHERARLGLFLAFQHPREIAGITVTNFLYAAARALEDPEASAATKSAPTEGCATPLIFHDRLSAQMRLLNMDPAFAERPVHKGFSGGEKKKLEVLQMLTLRPVLALLDETDSGLDMDALRTVAEGLNTLRKEEKSFAAILVTHNVRLLHLLKPDRLHVMVAGRIVESGGEALARKVEKEGFGGF